MWGGRADGETGEAQIGRLEAGSAPFWIPAYAGMTKGRLVIAAEAAIQEALRRSAPCVLGLSGPVLSRVEGPFELPQGERRDKGRMKGYGANGQVRGLS